MVVECCLHEGAAYNPYYGLLASRLAHASKVRRGDSCLGHLAFGCEWSCLVASAPRRAMQQVQLKGTVPRGCFNRVGVFPCAYVSSYVKSTVAVAFHTGAP